MMIEGVLEAETEQEALAKLGQLGYFPLSIRRGETPSEGKHPRAPSGCYRGSVNGILPFLRGNWPICWNRHCLL